MFDFIFLITGNLRLMENASTLNKLLSKQDIVTLLELINSLLLCQTESELINEITELSRLMPFNFSVCALATVTEKGAVESYSVVNVNYPEEWLQLYASNGYQAIDPIVSENFNNFKIQTWEETYRLHKPHPAFLTAAEDFDLKAGYTHGFKSGTEKQGSLFSFAGPSVEYHPKNNEILMYIIPHLHQALVRIHGPIKPSLFPPLTSREEEILKWIKKGKSSWEVSVICRISSRTINFHTNNIKEKLNAVNRAQAVAIALEHGLIDIE